MQRPKSPALGAILSANDMGKRSKECCGPVVESVKEVNSERKGDNEVEGVGEGEAGILFGARQVTAIN